MYRSQLEFVLIALLISTVAPGCSGEDNEQTAQGNDDVGVESDTGEQADAAGDADTAADAADTSVDAEQDSGPAVDAGPGQLVVTPTQLTFEDIRVDDTATATVTLANPGGSTIYISNLNLLEFDGGQPEFKPGEEWISDSAEIPAGTYRDIEVVYAPADQATDRGSLEIFSTAPDNGKVVLPIETVNAYPDIDAPKSFRFGSVAAGSTKTLQMIIYNRGIGDLEIDSVEITGEGEFSVAAAAAYEMPVPDTPVVLRQDEELILELTYSPQDDQVDRGTFIIHSSDPDQSDHQIALSGNEETACMRVDRHAIDFEQVTVGQPKTATVRVLNCSDNLPLELSSLEVSSDGGGAFEIVDPPELPEDIPFQSTYEFEVRASLDEARQAIGTLVVESNDEATGQVPINLTAEFVE